MNLRTLTVAIALLCMVLTALLPAITVVSAADEVVKQSSLVTVKLDGPSIIGAEVEDSWIIRITYSHPERIINYSYRADFTGSNTYGAKIMANNGTSSTGVFPVLITGPATAGKIKVRINATATETDYIWYSVQEFEITVVKPVYIGAMMTNLGNTPIENVSVKMYVDSELKSIKYYKMDANQTINLNFTWVFSSITSGAHIIKLVIDEPSKVVEFSEGNNVMTKTIYYSDSGNLIRGALSIVIMFVALALILTVLQKRVGPKKK